MEKIGLVVDTAGDIPRELVKEYDIREVPFYLYFEGEENNVYKEHITLTPEDFFNIMKAKKKHPKTSQPNMEDYYVVLEQLVNEGYKKIIIMTLSIKLSGSNQSAHLAKDEMKLKHPDTRIEIIDTESATLGEGLQQILAAKMIKKGVLSFDEIVNLLLKMRKNSHVFFTVEDLYFFYLGGRLGKGSVFLGNIMNLKPIMSVVDGEVNPIEKVRGRKKSLTRIADLSKETIKDMNNIFVASPQAVCPEDQKFLLDYFREITGYKGEIITRIMGTTIGAHPGPGTTGICFVEMDLKGVI
ncbi:MAG TPA: DegV family protein [Caldisericia bacterium]|nr:DegV family protein [Caldisericia bacterium]HPB33514.1 DegV family protein [Caldisericia bacterium]HQL67207.1 DegV family protein [Caldisericia bacterium]HQN48330.1 DegV family protein [Caldisericia bacterium]HQO99481.1 DegV family protein [Caldisericia bacterium]